MNQTDCPYCSLAKKKGELFCSHHRSDMANLKSGIFYIDTRAFDECDWHVTRLSLNFNLDQPQVYKTPSRSYSISPQRYLLLNEGQSFKTFANSHAANRMITIAFQVGLADKLLYAMQDNETQMLDNPFQTAEGKTQFLEKTYSLDAALYNTVIRLTDVEDDTQLDQALEALLFEIVKKQLNVRKEILSIKKSKSSTRLEVYKRLHWSVDYLHANFTSDITIDQLASVACLSPFHYKRLFSELFKLSPYQYLIKLRLESACSLLAGDRKVSEVCRTVGWKDPSSFARLFKRHYALTPEQYRHRAGGSLQ